MWKIACKIAVKSFVKQSPETKPPHFYKSHSFELVTIEIVIAITIGRFCGEDLKRLAHVIVRLQVSDYSQTIRLQLRRLIRASPIPSC